MDCHSVRSGTVWFAGVMAYPDTVLAACRASAVQHGERLPPCLQSDQWDLQAGLPAPREQVCGTSACPTSAGELSQCVLAYFGHRDPDSQCLLHHPQWQGDLECPFLSEQALAVGGSALSKATAPEISAGVNAALASLPSSFPRGFLL